MEIRVHGPGQEPEPLVVTMRTPGNDFDLAVGFCITEGVIDSASDVATVAYCLPDDGVQQYNIVTIRLRRPADLAAHHRGFVANASCGLCGKATLEQVEVEVGPVGPGPRVRRSALVTLPERLRSAQTVFDATGGLHAAACFGVDGGLTVLREDVGRHNAVDKVVGKLYLDGAHELRDRPEGGGRRDPRAVRGIGAFQFGGRGGRSARADRRRVPPRRSVQRLHASRARRPGVVT